MVIWLFEILIKPGQLPMVLRSTSSSQDERYQKLSLGGSSITFWLTYVVLVEQCQAIGKKSTSLRI